MKLRYWKVRTKLTLMVISFIAVLIFYATLSYNTRQQLQIDGPYFDRISSAQQLTEDISSSPLNLTDAFLTSWLASASTEASRRQVLIKKLQELHRSYNTVFARSKSALEREPNEALKQTYLVETHQPALQFFEAIESELIPAIRAGDAAKARKLLDGRLTRLYEQHLNSIEIATKLVAKKTSELHLEAEQLIQSRGILQLSLLIGSIALLALVIGPLISRSVTKPLASTVDALAETSIQLATTIEEHERTSMSQAAAVSQTTSAMDELEASFIQTAEIVRSAAERVQHSSLIAKEGIKTVHQMQEGMLDLKEKVGTTVAGQILSLSEQTAQISNITNQVGDLASQTNMLALNAAVEAARAGEHGKGFAVVAAEIRKLADASRKSAERINILVGDIQKSTNATVMATEESTKTVECVIRNARATVAAFNELKDASESAAESAQQTLLTVPQQVNAVKQVLESMEALNIGAKETSSAIGQTRIGSETLREEVSRLKSTI